MAKLEQLDSLLAQMQAMALRQAALEAQLQAAQAPPPALARRALVDTKGLGVPPQLDADGNNWAKCQIRVENDMELMNLAQGRR